MRIKGGKLVLPDRILNDTDVIIKCGHIEKLIRADEETPDETIDASFCFVCPGLIDIHTHGGEGGDFMDGDEASFDSALRFHADNGTTSVAPTSVTAPIEQIETMIALTRKFKESPHNGARVIGANLEGPYLSLKNKGAQSASYLRSPSEPCDFITSNRDTVLRVALAPELEGADALVKTLVDAGIQVSAGHDDGDSERSRAALDAGITSLTHWRCAMSDVRMYNLTRRVGLVELGLIDDRLTLELLADGHHLPPELVKIAYKCKGADKLCLVSDSLRAAGTKADGTLFTLGTKNDATAERFRVAGGVAVMEDGTHYAGSIQPLSMMLKNLVNDCGIPLCDAVKMASLVPARLVNKETELGSIEAGKKADFVILDKSLSVKHTIIDGKIYK